MELNVSPITLTRWAKTDSMMPRTHNLQRLIKALPDYREAFLELMPEDVSVTVKDESLDDTLQELPSVFYERVLHALANIPAYLRSQAIYDLILQQALEQLDPLRFGMAIIVVRCMPPWHDGRIRSLRETVGQGTSPWPRDLVGKTIFLGAESLVGYVAASGRSIALQNLEEGHSLFPAHRVEHEKSAAAYPILRGGMTTGCLLISSTQYDYFSPARLKLIQSYTYLISLAFEPTEFYPLESLELRAMPSGDVQWRHFSTFRQRVTEKMIQATRLRQSLNVTQAEQLVWQEIEEELLRLSLIEKKDATTSGE